MIPILFEGSETSFTSNGIGRLSDVISCEVTEKRNGAYELLMEYPIDGAHFTDIDFGKYIFAKPAKYSDNQPFEIYEITKPLNGIVTIYAYHISYRLSKIPVMPFTSDNVSSALAGLKTNSVETNPFTFTTTKTTVANYNQTEPRDCRSCLGGVQGSILDVYGGGEYEFDMFNIKLWQHRGQNRGFEIRYGKNITDLKQEESIENTITGIVPYYKNESVTVTLPEKVIETESAQSFPYPRTVPVDLSDKFSDSVPTEAQLRAAANAYIASHDIGIPKVSLNVSFVNLADIKGYENIAVLEDIRLCDAVTVKFEKLGVDATAKVVTTVYDTLKERFKSIELGEASNSLANRIAETERQQANQSSEIQNAVDRATNLITGVYGGYVVFHTGDDGKPYEILIMDTEDIETATKVWRWNKNGLGYSSTGYNGSYALAMTSDGEIVADFIKTGTLSAININGVNISGSTVIGGTVNGTTIKSEKSGLTWQEYIEISGAKIVNKRIWTDGITAESYIYGGGITFGESNGQHATIDKRQLSFFKDNSKENYVTIGDTLGLAIYENHSMAYWFLQTGDIKGSNLWITGTKNRIVKTQNYNDRLLYCYEMPSPMFGDIGEGKTDETGVCEVWLDDIFGETIDLDIKYQVFLQMYSEGSLKVTERNSMFFKVEGTPNASFAWELKAVQRDYDTMRLEEFEEWEEAEIDYLSETYNYLESLLYDVEGEAA